MAQGKLDQAKLVNEKCLRLNPNDPRIVAQKGEILTWQGLAEEGEAWVKKAISLDPYGAEAYMNLQGQALHMQRRYGEALATYNRITASRHIHHAFLASCHAHLGNNEAAKVHASELLKFVPDFSIAQYVASLGYANKSDCAHHGEGLRKAGLPE